jgi:hypothetical protein
MDNGLGFWTLGFYFYEKVYVEHNVALEFNILEY